MKYFSNRVLVGAILVTILCNCQSNNDGCTFEICKQEYGEQLSNPNLQIDLPQKPKAPSSGEMIKVFVTEGNSYYINDSSVLSNDLELAIMSKVSQTGDSIIELNGDQHSFWEDNVLVIDIAKKNYLKIIIKTTPNDSIISKNEPNTNLDQPSE